MRNDAFPASGRAAPAVPPCAGIGLRTPHYRELIATRPAVGWLEVHSENYFGDGGQPLHFLERLRADYPLSLHGVGLSLGSADGLDRAHLERLRSLARRFEPGLVSEHVCWSAVGGRHLHDLVPLPYTEESLALVCRHVDIAQDFLGRQLLIENVSSYLQFSHSTIAEWDFVAAVANATGCGILLDVNNVYVSAVNHGFDADRYVAALPPGSVREFHLAGFDSSGGILIDTHGSRVAPPVWALFRRTVERIGPRPTLIEWDTDIPALDMLLDEAWTADAVLETADAYAL